MKDPEYDDTNWRIDLDDVMKEYDQDRGGGIVVDSADTYRGLVMLGSMITNRSQETANTLKRYNNALVDSMIEGWKGEHKDDIHE